ncbi:MAG: 8-amino-7-oxononanoate synthase [Planctomycetota bacterium]|nr:8-amino-7-oxononanoate synthase [Planctomycetota bacterium]
MSRFDSLERRLEQLIDQDRLRRLVPRQIDGNELVVNHSRLQNFGSNDYLGLADRSVQAAAGGSAASALVCGWTNTHQQLAQELAAFESSESAVLFPSGYAACSGTIATLAERGDLILSDELNHASLIDGCRLSRAERVIYPHRDCRFVEKKLSEIRTRFERVWIVTDGVFSMDGHLAPLPQLADIGDRYNATLVVDEAHGTGVLGARGRGVCEWLAVEDRVPIRIGTLSKAIASQGGFVVGPRVVVDYLVNRCRSLIFSTALAPAAVAAARRSLRMIISEPQRREVLQQLSQQVRESLALPAGPTERGVPIIPVVLGSEGKAVDAAHQLIQQGFYVPAIRPPTVPTGTARLRISLSATHDAEIVGRLCEELGQMLP